jgi:hypothetical protein
LDCDEQHGFSAIKHQSIATGIGKLRPSKPHNHLISDTIDPFRNDLPDEREVIVYPNREIAQSRELRHIIVTKQGQNRHQAIARMI